MTRANKRKFHYIYKTTCSVTNKFYIGMHSTDSLEDGYAGSGTYLWRSIDKYGKENHSTEILEFLSSREELKLREAQIVNEELLGEKLCMNLKLGGEGGFTGKDGVWIGKPNNHKFLEKYANDADFRQKCKESYLERAKTRYEKYGLPKEFLDGSSFRGKNHSEETIRKMKEKKIGYGVGETNSQYGTCWIHNLDSKESKKIKKEELNIFLLNGWRIGRKIKF